MARDYYEVLGVPRNASQEELQAAYRRLSRSLHPDVNKDPSAEERFKEVGEAYHVLSDPEARARYDAMRSRGGGPGPRERAGSGTRGGPGPGFDFGRGPGGRRSRMFSEEDLGGGIDLEGLFGDLFGGAVKVRIPPGSSSGRRLRLRGQGMPNPRGAPGDLYAEVRIMVPSRLRRRERQLFEELSRVSSFDPRKGSGNPGDEPTNQGREHR